MDMDREQLQDRSDILLYFIFLVFVKVKYICNVHVSFGMSTNNACVRFAVWIWRYVRWVPLLELISKVSRRPELSRLAGWVAFSLSGLYILLLCLIWWSKLRFEYFCIIPSDSSMHASVFSGNEAFVHVYTSSFCARLHEEPDVIVWGSIQYKIMELLFSLPKLRSFLQDMCCLLWWLVGWENLTLFG